MLTYKDVSEFELHKFSTFASDIGLRAGDWPVEIETNMGNKMPFIRATKMVSPDGDLQWVTYYQACGCISLKVFND